MTQVMTTRESRITVRMTSIWLIIASLSAQASPPSTLVQALSGRHGVQDCRALSAYSDTLQADLLRVVEEVKLPPWAPMNAAICLIEEHPAASRNALLGWVQHPEQGGLARLVFRRLERFSEETALDVMQHALDGPHQQEALVATQADKREAVRALRPRTPPVR